MKTDYEIIKKKYGEHFAKFCRSSFPSLMEKPGMLPMLLEKKFAPSHFLYEDIKSSFVEDSFKNYIISQNANNSHTKPSDKTIPSPEELMAKVGYDLYKCETNEDIEKFRKYYKPTELICTFWDPLRIENNTIFFAVKKNAMSIKRNNFKNPKRQDEYGTSVISLQFTKGPESILSIKNRYNHTVPDPDATFSNDPENIIAGLTESFNKHYGIKLITGKQILEIPGYVMANDGKYYKYNYERDNIYYCPNNIIINHGQVEYYDKAKYDVADFYIFDKSRKKISVHPRSLHKNPFENLNISKIETSKAKNNGERLIRITTADNNQINLILNKYNQIEEYYNKYAETLDYGLFLEENNLKKFIVPNLKVLPEDTLKTANKLEFFYAPQLEIIEDSALKQANALKEFIVPNLKYIKANNLNEAYSLERFIAPNVISIGDQSLKSVPRLKTFEAPNLKHLGASCLKSSTSLETFNAPSLKVMARGVLSEAKNLKTFNAANLKEMHGSCLANALSLKMFSAPKLTRMGSYCLYNTPSLKKVNIPLIEELPAGILHNNSITSFSSNRLKRVGNNSFEMSLSLQKFNAPQLTKMGNNCLRQVYSLKQFTAPNIQEIGFNCLIFTTSALKQVNIPDDIKHKINNTEINTFQQEFFQ